MSAGLIFFTLLQLGGMNKDKLRGALSRLIVIMYTPRLERDTCLYVLKALSQPSPIRLLPLLAKSSDKFFFRFNRLIGIFAFTVNLIHRFHFSTNILEIKPQKQN